MERGGGKKRLVKGEMSCKQWHAVTKYPGYLLYIGYIGDEKLPKLNIGISS